MRKRHHLKLFSVILDPALYQEVQLILIFLDQTFFFSMSLAYLKGNNHTYIILVVRLATSNKELSPTPYSRIKFEDQHTVHDKNIQVQFVQLVIL